MEYEVYKDLDKFIKELDANKQLCAEVLNDGKQVIFNGSWSSVYRLTMTREGVHESTGTNA